MSSTTSRLARLAGSATTLLATGALAAAGQVGHLNDSAAGNTDWAAAIVLAGETPIHVDDIATFDLSTVQVLCINIHNAGPSAALQARVPDLTTWVSSGGVLVYHDRSLSTTAILPGGASTSLTFEPSGDVNVVTTGSLITDGPGGILNSTTLDSWTATTNGYATNLPVGAVNFLSNGPTASNSTGFMYPLGLGSVYYAPMPLDFYLAGLGPVEMVTAMSTIYAPNLVAYAANGGGSPTTLYCTGEGNNCPCGNAGAADRGCGNGSDVNGAALVATGYASIGSSTLVFASSGLVPGQPGLLFQGDIAVNGGAGVMFGDGLRCAGTNVVRLEVLNADASGESLSSLNVALAGGVAAGDSRAYQLWYRDPGGSPCGTGFNTTNGVLATWVP